jgi:hypothetical protein
MLSELNRVSNQNIHEGLNLEEVKQMAAGIEFGVNREEIKQQSSRTPIHSVGRRSSAALISR